MAYEETLTRPSHEGENYLALYITCVRMQMQCLSARRAFSRSTNPPLSFRMERGQGMEWNQSDMAFDDGDGDNKASFGHSLKRSGGGENIVAKISLQPPRGGVAIGSTRDTPIMIPQSLRNEKADSGGGAVCQWRNSPRSPIARRTGRSVTVNGNLLTVQWPTLREKRLRAAL